MSAVPGGPAPDSRRASILARLANDYGILFALVLLCGWFALRTYTEQQPVGAGGGQQFATELAARFPKGATVLIVARDSAEDTAFADALESGLRKSGLIVADTVKGQPAAARAALERAANSGQRLDAIACTQPTGVWSVFDNLGARFPSLATTQKLIPRPYRGSNFLKADNLLNIANQIAVIAIVAIGMTLVIITGGIDLSVGSLIALSAVTATLLIRNMAGAERASAPGMTLCCLVAIGACAGIGFGSGMFVTLFRLPAFIVTLAVMLVASGLAFIAAGGQSIYQVPDTFVWLGRGSSPVFLGLPNAVALAVALYGAAHLFMSRARFGRYVYAVGSNPEAARLSGVPVGRTLLLVYTLSGALAGLGGVVMASQLKSGAPTYGGMYELYVIAAVVVGGTSLSGGQGRVFGTLVGALLIAVIQNGMNLTGVESYTQKVVLGLVILGAVLLDTLKNRGVTWLRAIRR